MLKRRGDYPRDHEESPIASRNRVWKVTDRHGVADRPRQSKYTESDRDYHRHGVHSNRDADRHPRHESLRQNDDERGRRGLERNRSKNGRGRYEDSSDSSQDSRRPKRKTVHNIQDHKDRLARLELLKYDEEYKELVPKTDEKEGAQGATASIQDLQKLELCKKLGVNPVLLEKFSEELKISESKAPEQPQPETDILPLKKLKSFEDLDVDTHSRSVKSRSERSRLGQLEADPLDEFMSEIQKSNPQLAQTALKLTGNAHTQEGFSADFQTPELPPASGFLIRNR